MLITKYTITLLKEHDKKLEDILKLFKISYKGIDISKSSFEYDDNIIHIHTNVSDIDIIIYDEYYKVVKYFGNYQAESLYEMDRELFRKTTRFYLEDDKDLVIDEMTHKDFNFRRFLVTKKNDEELVEESFEREIFNQDAFGVHEEYKKEYISDTNYHCNKVINMPGNMYSQINDTIDIAPLSDILYGNVECSICVNEPKLAVRGKIDRNDEALGTSLCIKHPNIIVNGNIYYYENKVLHKMVFMLTIIKNDDQIDMSICNATQARGLEETQYEIDSQRGGISVNDINNIIGCICDTDVTEFYRHFLVRELEKLRTNVEVYESKRNKPIDYFIAKLHMIPRYEYLTLDVYENFDKYKNMLNGDTEIVSSSLKKKQ